MLCAFMRNNIWDVELNRPNPFSHTIVPCVPEAYAVKSVLRTGEILLFLLHFDSILNYNKIDASPSGR